MKLELDNPANPQRTIQWQASGMDWKRFDGRIRQVHPPTVEEVSLAAFALLQSVLFC